MTSTEKYLLELQNKLADELIATLAAFKKSKKRRGWCLEKAVKLTHDLERIVKAIPTDPLPPAHGRAPNVDKIHVECAGRSYYHEIKTKDETVEQLLRAANIAFGTDAIRVESVLGQEIPLLAPTLVAIQSHTQPFRLRFR